MLETVQNLGRFLFYVGLPLVMVSRPAWFFLWLPLAPVCGLWVEALDLGPGSSHLSSYVETILVLCLLAAWVRRKDKSRVSIYLLLLALLLLPSFLNAGDHFLFSLFFFVGLLAGPGVYDFFRDHAPRITEGPLLDRMVLAWNLLALAVRAYDAATLSGEVLQMRGGGIWASNHYGGIMLLLLPLVRSPWIAGLTLGIMALQFSRGIYLALAVFGLFWGLRVAWRPVLKAAGAMLLAGAVAWAFLPQAARDVVTGVVVERFAFEGMEIADVSAATVLERAEQDDRVKIHQYAWAVARDTHFMGVGPGGFYFGMKRLQSDQLFSNAHNLYLTALAEGGAAFLVAFCAFLAWALGTAWRYHPKAFAGLMAWTVYGFYSGELWEAARFASCMDFYYLLFLLACVTGAAGRGRAGGMEPAWP